MITQKTKYFLQYPKGHISYPNYVGVDSDSCGYPYPASTDPMSNKVFSVDDENQIPDYLYKMEPKFNIVEIRWSVMSVTERK